MYSAHSCPISYPSYLAGGQSETLFIDYLPSTWSTSPISVYPARGHLHHLTDIPQHGGQQFFYYNNFKYLHTAQPLFYIHTYTYWYTYLNNFAKTDYIVGFPSMKKSVAFYNTDNWRACGGKKKFPLSLSSLCSLQRPFTSFKIPIFDIN